MIAGCNAELDSERHSTTRLQLIGMHPHSEALGGAGAQDGTGLVDVECAPIAEHVDPS